MVTRQRLLAAAFREIHKSGFRAADLERILDEAGVTKGALYYHFASKRGLGYAVVEEVLHDWILDRWLRPVETASDPLATLSDLARWGEGAATPEGISLGCPLNNLSQELGGVDEGFRLRLAAIYDAWREGLAGALVRAQERGVVRRDVDVQRSAAFVVAAWQGSIGLGKALQSSEVLSSCRHGLEVFLRSLKAP